MSWEEREDGADEPAHPGARQGMQRAWRRAR